MTRSLTVAGGRFAPGHLGELTQVLPFELVDAVLEETRSVQRRLRDLPSRVGVYFVLAMCLFPEVGYRLVWQKLITGLIDLDVARPSTKALRDLRRRVGATPLQRLFEVLAGTLAQPSTRGVRFGPFRTVSFDGCSSIKIPDSSRNTDRFGPQSRGGYPMLELMTLVETGTRALIGAVFGPTREGETDYARRLLHHLRPDMLVLWDKGFDANAFLAAVADTGAQFLGRIRANRRTPVLVRLADGSYLSVIGTVPVRIVEAQIVVTCKDGTSFTGSYRLATTLTDAGRYPAGALVALYHQRWEHESTYYALRHTLLRGRVLRSADPAGVEQELWAHLALYQALRTVMVEAAESRPGTDPDRCGFTTALHTARDLVVQAAGVTGCGTTGVISQRILAGLLPPRRPRVSTRKVKSPISRYHARQDDGRPDTSRTVTGLDISILEPEPELPAASHDDRHISPDDRRRQRVLEVLDTDPDRHWHPRDLARHLGDVTLGVARQTFWHRGLLSPDELKESLMSRPPQFPVEDKIRIVLSVLAGEMTVAEAARRNKTSQTSVAKWRDQFLESGKAGLTAGTSKQASSREAMLEEQIEDLKAALGEAHVELRVWKKSAEGRLAPSRTSR